MARFVVFGFDTAEQRRQFLSRLGDTGRRGHPSHGGWTPPGGTFTPQWAVTVPEVVDADLPELRALGRAFDQHSALVLDGDVAAGYRAAFWDLATDVVGAWAPYVPLAPGATAPGWTEHRGVRWTRTEV